MKLTIFTADYASFFFLHFLENSSYDFLLKFSQEVSIKKGTSGLEVGSDQFYHLPEWSCPVFTPVFCLFSSNLCKTQNMFRVCVENTISKLGHEYNSSAYLSREKICSFF